MKTKLAVIAVVMFAIWALKRYYSDARVDDLWWVLGPTAWLVGIRTGTVFAMTPGEGYFSREHLFLIEKACAGINFMIAAFGMVAFALVHRVQSSRSAASVIAVSFVVGYAAAVIVNTLRIAIAMWVAAHPIAVSAFTAAEVHRLEGITIYFGGLVLLHEFVRRLDRRVVPAEILR